MKNQLSRWFQKILKGEYDLEGFDQLKRAWKERKTIKKEIPPAPAKEKIKSLLKKRGGLKVAIVSYHTNPLFAIRERVKKEEDIEIDLRDQGGQGVYQERLASELASEFGVEVFSFTLKRSYLQKEKYLNIHPKAPVIPVPNPSGKFVQDETGFVRKEDLYFIIDELVKETLNYLLKKRVKVEVFSGHYAEGVAACRRLKEAWGKGVFSATTHSLGWNKFINVAPEYTPEELARLNLNLRFKEEKEGLQKADLVITVSPDEVETVVNPNLYGVREEKVVPIPGGFDTRLFRPFNPLKDRKKVKALQKNYGITQERLILMMGRLWDYKRKGVDTAIKVCGQIKKKTSYSFKLRFVFVGLPPKKDPTREKIEALMEKSGIKKEAVLVEMIPHEKARIWLWLTALSGGVFLALPRTEPWGLANLEAMATENVVVTINKEGPTHYIEDGETGLLVDRENPSQVAKRIITILKRQKLARRLAKKAQEKVSREFSWSSVARRFLWHHLSLLDKP